MRQSFTSVRRTLSFFIYTCCYKRLSVSASFPYNKRQLSLAEPLDENPRCWDWDHEMIQPRKILPKMLHVCDLSLSFFLLANSMHRKNGLGVPHTRNEHTINELSWTVPCLQALKIRWFLRLYCLTHRDKSDICFCCSLKGAKTTGHNSLFWIWKYGIPYNTHISDFASKI